MSEDTLTADHTVFYLIHKHMKATNRIDHPITIEKPKYLKKILLEIQEHHLEILKYKIDFDENVKERQVHAHLQREENRRWRLEVERRQAALREAEQREVRRREIERQQAVDEVGEQQQQPAQGPVRVDAVSPPAPKRRRIAPNRLNIASTREVSYQ